MLRAENAFLENLGVCIREEPPMCFLLCQFDILLGDDLTEYMSEGIEQGSAKANIRSSELIDIFYLISKAGAKDKRYINFILN